MRYDDSILTNIWIIMDLSLPKLAKKVKKIASHQLINFKQFLRGRGFSKFKKHYKLMGELGRGGFGVVYSAIRIVDELPVAVKLIERKHVREWGKLNDERCPMEICMLARCNRIDGVINLIDWFSIADGFLIVMERPYPCIDLFDFCRNQGKLDENLTRFLFKQIVATIAGCNDKKVIHRDIKDENIVIDLITGETKLIDFGAATILKTTHYSNFQGTRIYCPPEWFLHSVYMGREAAVWSLGILLYHMLNGRSPFKTEKEICTMNLIGDMVFHANLSDDSKDLLRQCLHFDPCKRATIDQIRAHPWFVKETTIDWLQLNTNSMYANQNDQSSTMNDQDMKSINDTSGNAVSICDDDITGSSSSADRSMTTSSSSGVGSLSDLITNEHQTNTNMTQSSAITVDNDSRMIWNTLNNDRFTSASVYSTKLNDKYKVIKKYDYTQKLRPHLLQLDNIRTTIDSEQMINIRKQKTDITSSSSSSMKYLATSLSRRMLSSMANLKIIDLF